VTVLRTRAGPRLSQPGFVLRRFPYGESSLIVHLLTPEHGRVAVLAKGAYRPSSGFYAVFDLFDTLEVRWSGARAGELGLVSAASVRTRRPALGLDLERYRTGLSLLELARTVWPRPWPSARAAAVEARSVPGTCPSRRPAGGGCAPPAPPWVARAASGGPGRKACP
jgi:hypothetical protein